MLRVSIERVLSRSLAFVFVLTMAGFSGVAESATPASAGVRVERDLAYGEDARQRLDIYVPEGLKGPAPVILFFYGGSWQHGEKAMYAGVGQLFASLGIVVAVADYRLYPQVHYPAFVEDGALALRFVHDHAKNYGGDASRVFVAGHSAGAYIAVMLASDPAYVTHAGGTLDWIAGAIGMSGPYDFLPLFGEPFIDMFGGSNRAETQPINHIDGRRPPMLLVTGDDDETVDPRNVERMAARLLAAGSHVETKIYPGVSHAGTLLSLAPDYRPATTITQDIARFIQGTSR